MSDNPRFKEISNMSLNSATLVDFITRQRRRLGWETTAKDENEVIFFLAVVGSVISAILVAGLAHLFVIWVFLFCLIWSGAITLYISVRREGKGDNCKDMDHAIDVIKKSIKRGKVGIERKHSDLFWLVGTYHNDLIGEDISDSIALVEKDMTELYDSLEGIGNFRDQTQVELPVSTV